MAFYLLENRYFFYSSLHHHIKSPQQFDAKVIIQIYGLLLQFLVLHPFMSTMSILDEITQGASRMHIFAIPKIIPAPAFRRLEINIRYLKGCQQHNKNRIGFLFDIYVADFEKWKTNVLTDKLDSACISSSIFSLLIIIHGLRIRHHHKDKHFFPS